MLFQICEYCGEKTQFKYCSDRCASLAESLMLDDLEEGMHGPDWSEEVEAERDKGFYWLRPE